MEKTEQEIKDLAKKHFFEGQNEKELAIARIGFVEGYKQAQPKWIDASENIIEVLTYFKNGLDDIKEATGENQPKLDEINSILNILTQPQQ